MAKANKKTEQTAETGPGEGPETVQTDELVGPSPQDRRAAAFASIEDTRTEQLRDQGVEIEEGPEDESTETPAPAQEPQEPAGEPAAADEAPAAEPAASGGCAIATDKSSAALPATVANATMRGTTLVFIVLHPSIRHTCTIDRSSSTSGSST